MRDVSRRTVEPGQGPAELAARALLTALLDAGSFTSWDQPPLEVAGPDSYRDELSAAAAAAGTDESVLTGSGLLRGRPVAVIACEFGFLAGSIGVAAAERIVRAVERATELGLPLLAAPTSGGTRMQEGTLAFVQMVKIAGAVAAHKAAGYPYVVYLRNPTMGGVFASWGSLGHITFAEPGALIGFLGPRVYTALYGRDFPAGVQTAENLYRNGVIDGVVGVTVFRRIAYRALSVFSGSVTPTADSESRRYTTPRDIGGSAPNAGAAVENPDPSRPRTGDPGRNVHAGAPGPDADAGARSGEADAGAPVGNAHTGAPAGDTDTGTPMGGRDARIPAGDVDTVAPMGEVDCLAVGEVDAAVPAGESGLNSSDSVGTAWDSVRISRRPDRPGLRGLLRQATHRVPLSGTGQGESDHSVVLALARFRGQPCVVFGHDRRGQDAEHTMGPAALREARRSMQLAAELRIPLVLVIDTVGAALSKEAEERGLASEIARCLADLVTLDTPTVSVLLGQGTGGGALALLPADRVLAAAHGWLAPLPPEGASAIVHRDTDHAPELAERQRIRASDLLADGIVDHIVAENPDAAVEPVEFARRMVAAIARELTDLRAESLPDLRATRHRRYRRLGLPR